VKDSLHAYQLSKRGNSLRVMAEAGRARTARSSRARRLDDGGVTAAYWYGDLAPR
jgi:hypothetical protein